MTVLHLNDKLEILGGVEVYIDQLLKYGKDFSINDYWAAINKKSATAYQFEVRNDVKAKLNSLSALSKYIIQYCDEQKIDLIHVHSISNPSLIKELFKIRPVVRSMHEPRIVCPGQGKFWRKSERICDQPFGAHCLIHAYTEGCCNRHPKRLIKAYRNVKFETTQGKDNYAAIFAMSDYMIQEALKVGFDKNQLVLNPYFTEHVENDKLCDQSKAKIKAISFIGRLSRTKGVHYFIESGLELLKKNQDLHFNIIGDGHDADFFKRLVPREYELYFTFHGWKNREQINQFLHQSYLLVFPSIYPEAFGISGIEAMMRGKPVVGFDVGGVSTWLRDGKTGSLAQVKNTAELSKKIDDLLDDSKNYKSFSDNARKTCLEEFSVNRHMDLLSQTYTKAMKP